MIADYLRIARTRKNYEINRFKCERVNAQQMNLELHEIEIEALWVKIQESEVKAKEKQEKFVWT